MHLAIQTKVILLAVFAFLMLFSGVSFSEEPHYSNGFKYNDQDLNEKVLKNLKKNDIPIIISDDDFITYPGSHEVQVQEILKSLPESLSERSYSVFYQKIFAENFSKLLDENNIDHEIKIYSNESVHVYWNHSDDNQARELEKKNLKRIFNL